MRYQSALDEIKESCAKNNVTLILQPNKRVRGGENYYSGYFEVFENEPPKLVIATKRSDWFFTLLHEYHHMQQWLLERQKWFSDYKEYEDFLAWLEYKKQLSKKDIKKVFNEIISCELDCENKVVKYIKRNKDLGIDIENYIQRANASLYIYSIVAKHRKWPNNAKNSPCAVRKIIKIMPNKLQRSYWKIPEGYEELVLKYCF